MVSRPNSTNQWCHALAKSPLRGLHRPTSPIHSSIWRQSEDLEDSIMMSSFVAQCFLIISTHVMSYHVLSFPIMNDPLGCSSRSSGQPYQMVCGHFIGQNLKRKKSIIWSHFKFSRLRGSRLKDIKMWSKMIKIIGRRKVVKMSKSASSWKRLSNFLQ